MLAGLDPRRRPGCLLLLLALAGGCPEDCSEKGDGHYISTSGRWTFSTAALQFDPCEKPGAPDMQTREALLAGTRWCPSIGCDEMFCPTAPDLDVLTTCYSTVADGPATADGPCLQLTGDGEVVWRFEPLPCATPGIFLPEQITLRSAAAPALRGRLVSYLDTMSRKYLSAETGEFPADLEPAADATTLKVAADQPLHLAIDLRIGDRRVAWPAEGAAIAVDTLRGAPPTVELDERSTLFLQVPAGSEAALTLTVEDAAVPLGRVLGLPPDALADLELVVAYGRNPDDGSRMPIGARAVVRDRDGDLVYGARAEWEVLDGSFPLSAIPFYRDDSNHDYIALVDTAAAEDESAWCFTNPDTGARSYTGRIAAQVADLHAEVDLAWSAEIPPPGGFGDLFAGTFNRPKKNTHCQGPGFADDDAGCGCRSAPPTASLALLALLALLSLGTARRRRHRITPAARVPSR